MADEQEQLLTRPTIPGDTLTDFDIEFYDALDKKIKEDPGQVTFKFVDSVYSKYQQKIEQGEGTERGQARLQGIFSKYIDTEEFQAGDSVGTTKKPKYLGTKTGGRIKRKKNYSRGGGVRPASY